MVSDLVLMILIILAIIIISSYKSKCDKEENFIPLPTKRSKFPYNSGSKIRTSVKFTDSSQGNTPTFQEIKF